MANLISVIVPVYNVQPYLKRCLDSILEQTYSDIEIVAVDDGSTDGSELLLDQYAATHPSFRVIHQENSGVTVARLRGVSEASGDWIGFIDADDYIEPEMYSILINNALEYDADISHCGYQLIHLDGNRHYFYDTKKIIEQNNFSGLKDLIEGKFVEPGMCNKLYRRKLFDSILLDCPIDSSIKITEDMLFNFFLFRQSRKSVYYDFCPYHYFARETSASRKPLADHHIFDPIKVKNIIVENVPSQLFEIAKRQYVVNCISAYSSVSTNSNKEYRNRLPKLFELFKAEKRYFNLLNYKYKLLAYALLYFRPFYPIVYRFAKLFAKKDVYY